MKTSISTCIPQTTLATTKLYWGLSQTNFTKQVAKE